MTKKELREYLGIVVDMEKNIFLQKDLINHFDRELAAIKNENLKFPDKPSPPEKITVRDFILTAILLALGCIGIFIAAAFVIVIISGFLAELNNESISQYNEHNWLWLLAVILPILWVAKLLIGEHKFTKEREAKYQENLKQYQQKSAEIGERLRRNSIKTTFIQKERTKAEIALDASTQRLQKIYDKNIIFPKYRNLVMVCSIYEYICAGRCDKLEGHDGAYNILETEIRLDRIITELIHIVYELSSIRQNQYTLYSAIQDSNRQSARLLDSSERMASSLEGFHGEVVELNKRIASMQKTSELTAYCSERTQKELAYMNRMNYLSGRNDNVFWNVPPTWSTGLAFL